MTKKELKQLAWSEVWGMASNITCKLRGRRIFGVPRGGVYVALLVCGCDDELAIMETPEEADTIVDDIIDSGSTRDHYRKYEKPFYALIEKPDPKYWYVFPWERMNKDPLPDYIKDALEAT